ncbi:MAG: hypothetical protein LCH84_04045 [Gemmatimonadetes bacterium]|nr:hypothetical protein [Gemmatimonadota bacterium]
MARFALRPWTALLVVTGAAACSLEPTASSRVLATDAAFNSAPAGMEATSTSFATDSGGVPWGGPRRGGPGGPGLGGLMGGGLEGNFLAGRPGRGPHGGPFGGVRIDSTCTVSGGNVTCAATRNGLAVSTIYTITSLTGAAQTAIDTLTTNTVRTRTTVTGTTSRSRDGSVTATVNHSSDRTVTGLAPSSTQRTVNGWTRGTESITGTNRDGEAFTSQRVAGDTTTGLVIPVSSTTQTYPTAGTVVRSMSVTTTVAGATPTVRTRREVLTYDGSATAKLVLTVDGVTKNCTVALPRGRPSCS